MNRVSILPPAHPHREKALWPEHPDVRSCRGGLAKTLWLMGRSQEGEALGMNEPPSGGSGSGAVGGSGSGSGVVRLELVVGTAAHNVAVEMRMRAGGSPLSVLEEVG